jgi:hypothetical protein
MAKRILLLGAAPIVALAFHVGAFAQSTPQFAAPEAFQPPATATVQQLAPQLLPFAGSAANFQSLVNGLALGLPVTLVTTSVEGLTQSVTFTPNGTRSAVDVARVLEQARQNLIARGIATPSAEQLGVALTGGNLSTALGAVPMSGLVQIGSGTAAGTGTSASAGSSISSNVPAAASAAGTTTGAAATTGTRAAQPRFTSDNASVVGTSDTPLPLTSGTPTSGTPAIATGTSNSAVPAAAGRTATFGAAPAVNAAPASNGAPSPAAQIQGRR